MLIGGVLSFGGSFHAESYVQAEENHVVIKKGDTLYSLAKKYGTTVEELKEINKFSSHTIYVGQELLVPSTTLSEPLYIVMAGSFSSKKNADKRVVLLKKKGIDAVVVNRVIKDQTYYRIQAGAYSKKENAEKQLTLIKNAGITDAYFMNPMPLNIKEVTIGNTYNNLIDQFGVPNFSEEQMNTLSLYYQNEGAGVRVQFNMKTGLVEQLQIYPEFLLIDDIPRGKKKIIEMYGHPDSLEEVTCYETATCEKLTYQLDGNQLTVQIDRDGDVVQFLELIRFP